MIWHSTDLDAVRVELDTDFTQGLGEAQAAHRLAQYGYNQSRQTDRVPFGQRFFAQLKSLPVVVLAVAAVIEIFMTLFLKEGTLLTPVFSLLLLGVNGLIGAYLEADADKASDTMQHMTFPKARVIRDGKKRLISANELVPGDLIELQEGDFIPADARLLQSDALRCDEQRITGEAVVAVKKAEQILSDICLVHERNNMVYATAQVTQGSALAVVVETGMGCEYAKLERVSTLADPAATPVRDRIKKLGKILQYLVSGIALLVFVLGIFLVEGKDLYLNILDMFTTSVALTVAAVPYTLAVLVSAVYAHGILRILRKKAVIKKFGSLETLGTVSVICADKTGTLTSDSMEVRRVFDGHEITTPGEDSNDRIKTLLLYGALCCDAARTVDESGREQTDGDATELGIIAAAQRFCGTDKHTLENTCPRMACLPFDGERKLMTTVNVIGGKPVAIVRGSTDKLLPLCDGLDQNAMEEINDQMAKSALRVIAIGYKYLDEVPAAPTAEELENGLTFLGMIGLRDRPRDELDEALASCRASGIRTVMITGEYITAAAASAKQLGILGGDRYAVTGEDLQQLDDEKLLQVVERIAVYSRISPEDKIRVVRAWQKRGHVVALTGDGVKDAESLRVADVGCAMGAAGSDLARDSADVTLSDNSFATIVTAIAHCRGLYDNIRRVIQYLLGANLAELLTLLLVIVFYRSCPLEVVQLLLLTVLTKSVPAIWLGSEPPAADIMHRPPRDRDEPILSQNLILRTLGYGVLLALSAFVAGAVGQAAGAAQGSTMVFGVLALGEIFSTFSLRGCKPVWSNSLKKNLPLLLNAVLVTLIVCLLLAIPVLRTAVSLSALAAWQWLLLFVFSLLPLAGMEVFKFLNQKFLRRF